MGIHDFVCLVQRNGQYILALELLDKPMDFKDEYLVEMEENDDSDGEETERDSLLRFLDGLDIEGKGLGEAMLVRIPTTVATRKEILTWPLTKFKDYAASEVEYHWDGWDFIENGKHLHYNQIFTSSSSVEDEAVWQKDGFWIINFDPVVYKAFVLQEVDCYRIPASYYLAVLQNRGKKIESYPTLDKKLVYHDIINTLL